MPKHNFIHKLAQSKIPSTEASKAKRVGEGGSAIAETGEGFLNHVFSLIRPFRPPSPATTQLRFVAVEGIKPISSYFFRTITNILRLVYKGMF